jgi:hypothetical protein
MYQNQDPVFVAQVEWTTPLPSLTLPIDIPPNYQKHCKVFSEQATQQFTEPRIWDHAIKLKPNVSSTIPRKVYVLTQLEQEELKKFVQEHMRKGYICPLKSPYTTPFFFIKKKDSKLHPVQDY